MKYIVFYHHFSDSLTHIFIPHHSKLISIVHPSQGLPGSDTPVFRKLLHMIICTFFSLSLFSFVLLSYKYSAYYWSCENKQVLSSEFCLIKINTSPHMILLSSFHLNLAEIITLNILLSSSNSDFPGKRGFLVKNSAKMHPTDHMSIAVLYSCNWKIGMTSLEYKNRIS